MESIERLDYEYVLLRIGVGNYERCVEWAEDRLRRDEEGDDLDVVLLAGASELEDVLSLVEKIVVRYCGAKRLDEHFVAGKYVVQLRDSYLKGDETIESLDGKLTSLYAGLEHPSWLVMLSRNCEYATDVSAFEEPFEREFFYIAELWRTASSTADFRSKYSREVSNQHDAKSC